jgi:hypothetical protein
MRVKLAGSIAERLTGFGALAVISRLEIAHRTSLLPH